MDPLLIKQYRSSSLKFVIINQDKTESDCIFRKNNLKKLPLISSIGNPTAENY